MVAHQLQVPLPKPTPEWRYTRFLRHDIGNIIRISGTTRGFSFEVRSNDCFIYLSSEKADIVLGECLGASLKTKKIYHILAPEALGTSIKVSIRVDCGAQQSDKVVVLVSERIAGAARLTSDDFDKLASEGGWHEITLDNENNRMSMPVCRVKDDQNGRVRLKDATLRTTLETPGIWNLICRRIFATSVITENPEHWISVAVMGSRGVGKSTLLRYIVNHRLTSCERSNILYLDTDLGQPELGVPGFVRLSQLCMDEPLLYNDGSIGGASMARRTILTQAFMGSVTPADDPERYLEAILRCMRVVDEIQGRETQNPLCAGTTLFVNLQGWITSLGYHLAQAIATSCRITHLVRIDVDDAKLADFHSEENPFIKSSVEITRPISFSPRMLSQALHENLSEVSEPLHRALVRDNSVLCSTDSDITDALTKVRYSSWDQESCCVIDLPSFSTLVKSESHKKDGLEACANHRGSSELETIRMPSYRGRSFTAADLRWLRFSCHFNASLVLSCSRLFVDRPYADFFLRASPYRVNLDILKHREYPSNARVSVPTDDFRPHRLIGTLCGVELHLDSLTSHSQIRVELGFVHSVDLSAREMVIFFGETFRIPKEVTIVEVIMVHGNAAYQWTSVPSCSNWNSKNDIISPYFCSWTLQDGALGAQVRSGRTNLLRQRLQIRN